MSGPRAAVAAAWLGAAAIVLQPACKFPQPPKPVVTAEADVYSGRVNPFWSVSGRDSVTLRQMVTALQPGSAAPEPPGLGYRGIVVHNAGQLLARCYDLRVYRGAVAAQCETGARTLADPGRQVERFLAETGLKRADPAAYDLAQQDFAAAP
ncbi:MAG TPA: hypothetical protein VFJ82_23015 [Longimicrobium sp.]|nr:hypothetical protein [Longimicrobium sp.]